MSFSRICSSRTSQDIAAEILSSNDWARKYIRTHFARGELFRPAAEHKRRMLGDHGSPRFGAEVCKRERPNTERSEASNEDWCNLDIMMQEQGTMHYSDD